MNSNLVARSLAAAALSATAFAGQASAATDGTLGATSTGSISINASVAGRVQISKLSDVTISGANPGSAQATPQDICVWSNTVGRRYNITAQGSGDGSAFTLASGALPAVPYSVEWSQTSGQATGSALNVGIALTGQSSVATNPTCSSGPATSASLIVRMAAADLQTMQAGATYAGTLTLVVAPE